MQEAGDRIIVFRLPSFSREDIRAVKFLFRWWSEDAVEQVR
jgi:hypothetical protein